VEDKKGGHLHGNAEIEVELISLVIDGKKIDADSDVVKRKKGALSTKAMAAVKPGAVGAAEVAVSVNPIGAASNRGCCAGRDRCIEGGKSTDQARYPNCLHFGFSVNLRFPDDSRFATD
jgi:hypothetical protein